MTRTLALSMLLLSGCSTLAPAGGGPPPDPRVSAGDPEVLRCTTAAFEGDDFAPVALRIREDFNGPNAYFSPMTLGAAHPDQDGVVAAPTDSWDEQSYITLADGLLTFEGESLSLQASRHPDFTERMFVGTLTYGELGTHDVTCWFEDFVSDFTYVEGEGCFDAAGTPGHNPLPIPYLRDTLDAHCASFAGQMINEDFLGYPTFVGMDLRGAVLDSAELFFAHILESSWEGADLTGFEFGYAFLSGTVDASTVILAENCGVQDDWLDCMR